MTSIMEINPTLIFLSEDEFNDEIARNPKLRRLVGPEGIDAQSIYNI